MKRSIRLALAFFGAAALFSVTALPGTLSAAKTQQLAHDDHTDVIVILRDQLPSMPAAHGLRESRTAALAASRTSVVAELQQAGARKIHGFQMINAVAATVTKAESARLAAHPLVAAVVPDLVIKEPKRRSEPESGSIGANWAGNSDGGLCNTLEPEALQLMNAAFSNSGTAQAQTILDGNGVPVTGKGVKVAFLADGLDTTLPGFVRPDGSSVFVDYQDFSGDPAGTPTGGGEAFGDASSIAAQDRPNGKVLTFDISRVVSAAHPLPSPCTIRIRGVAPGASLVGLKIFSNLGYTTTSGIVQAIEYAVLTDDVDVINESFGGNPFPDNLNDPVSLANDAAVAGGVTVVVSTGDSGSAGTLGSPSTDYNVIAAGASTSLRLYAQTQYGAQPFATGYISNNISSLSSGGFGQTGARTVDVVAPGDLGWALCSTNTTLYTDCNSTYNGKPAPVEDFGGTSESAPLTSATAALVIQAYRSTHRGYDPPPALVKRIIMSTATDLGAPSYEQGAGLVNSLAAVQAALSVEHGGVTPKPRGETLLSNPTSAAVIARPNAPQNLTFTITNNGAKREQVEPKLETLGAAFAGATLNLQLNPATDPTFVNWAGATRAYITQEFKVPAGAQHLDAAVAVQVVPPAAPIVYLSLLDPSGRQAIYSIPQGLGSGYQHVDVVKPAAGTWTAVIWTRPPGAPGSYTGPVQFTWGAERFTSLGSVWPSSVDLKPGDSQTFTVKFDMPSQPGDLGAAIRFASGAWDGSGAWGGPGASGSASHSEIPLSLRTLIPTSSSGGEFTGTLTGGNGRAGSGPTQTFAFDVPKGVNDMSLVLEVPDNGYALEGLLVDPNGMQLSVQENLDPSGAPQYAVQLYRYNPQPGRWRFVLLQNFISSGNQTSIGFTARIGFNTAEVSAAGLPDDPSVLLSASGTPVTIPVTVTNTGAVTEAYFADGRLSTLGVQPLAAFQFCAPPTLPGACELFFVPTEVNSIQFIAQASAPINMDVYNDAGYNVGATGAPDLYALQVAPDTVVASLSVPEVPYGPWVEWPALMGPYTSTGAPTVPVNAGAFALMQPFDPAVTADSGDQWADLTFGTSTYNPLVLAPGASGIINVTITPDPTQPIGATIRGYLYIDTFNYAVFTGDEVVRIPYTYTIAP